MRRPAHCGPGCGCLRFTNSASQMHRFTAVQCVLEQLPGETSSHLHPSLQPDSSIREGNDLRAPARPNACRSLSCQGRQRRALREAGVAAAARACAGDDRNGWHSVHAGVGSTAPQSELLRQAVRSVVECELLDGGDVDSGLRPVRELAMRVANLVQATAPDVMDGTLQDMDDTARALTWVAAADVQCQVFEALKAQLHHELEMLPELCGTDAALSSSIIQLTTTLAALNSEPFFDSIARQSVSQVGAWRRPICVTLAGELGLAPPRHAAAVPAVLPAPCTQQLLRFAEQTRRRRSWPQDGPSTRTS